MAASIEDSLKFLTYECRSLWRLKKSSWDYYKGNEVMYWYTAGVLFKSGSNLLTKETSNETPF